MREKRQKYVAYYRVSTNKQSEEMPAQKTAVKTYLKDKWPPVENFTEIMSGKSAKNGQSCKRLWSIAKSTMRP